MRITYSIGIFILLLCLWIGGNAQQFQAGAVEAKGIRVAEGFYMDVTGKNAYQECRIEFDDQGRKTKWLYILQNGDVYDEEVFNYDVPDPPEEVIDKAENAMVTTIRRDAQGRIQTKQVDLKGGPMLYMQFYHYNAEGLLTSIVSKTDEGRKIDRMEYRYNDKGQLVRQMEFRPYYMEARRWEFHYDAAGLCEEKVLFVRNQKHGTTTYRYKEK